MWMEYLNTFMSLMWLDRSALTLVSPLNNLTVTQRKRMLWHSEEFGFGLARNGNILALRPWFEMQLIPHVVLDMGRKLARTVDICASSAAFQYLSQKMLQICCLLFALFPLKIFDFCGLVTCIVPESAMKSVLLVFWIKTKKRWSSNWEGGQRGITADEGSDPELSSHVIYCQGYTAPVWKC